MSVFKNKSKNGRSCEIFCRRDDVYYGRLEISQGQWEAASWSLTGKALNDTSTSNDDLILKTSTSASDVLKDTIHSLDGLMRNYYNLPDEKKKEILAIIDKHNQRVFKKFQEGEGMRADFLNVGKLKEKLKNVPDHLPVVYHRIHDSYFEGTHSGWTENSYILPFDHIDDVTEHVQAWDARQHKDLAFLLTAHY